MSFLLWSIVDQRRADAVVGSITAVTAVILSAGNPERSAWLRIRASLGAL
jgi:hypothetical protein